MLEWGEAAEHRLPVRRQVARAERGAAQRHHGPFVVDFDDVHEDAIMHPGVVAIPTALAVAEYVGGLSGSEFIAAVALGTDFICAADSRRARARASMGTAGISPRCTVP